ncbi:MAG: bifunctional diaminohydroxyphosphoribosylaminopyrimidine deaminase/5-amino-6-(5-phosphoribosylamino)uracil reductase RibD [Gemmatimonadetes bacterium]|nr:bifunctional diaminohydroxyphosphoribosylaminopyrimidine deaminase/5-amino-6-(5-phosphoribosylamino)uracil reductase RibD [Gemmatimonadota bacterium]
MLRALELAWHGWGRVHPNPMVGAVVVQGAEVVGEGFHAEYGGPHAEVVALTAAGSRARGATIYVSLEPCAHHGKTPPCTDALIRAGVARVVFGARDPTRTAGGGAEVLATAGIAVQGGVSEVLVRRQNAIFFHHAERQSIFVALKLAMTLDAKLAQAPGQRTQISAPEAVEEAHRLRAGFDAILVGVETAVVDDPLLTARGRVRPRQPPARVVLDSHLRLPPEAQMLRERSGPVLLLCAEEAPVEARSALQAAGAHVIPVPASRAGVDLGAALQVLGERGFQSILCEGGGRVASALLHGQHVHRLYIFLAPRVFGAQGVSAFAGDLDPRAMSGWSATELKSLGSDVLVVFDRES